MTKLSPAAQAVYDAVLETSPAPADEIAAAALRAAAERLGYELELDDLSSTTLYLVDANCLLDIAAELEGDHD
jgi:hypothetical protein